MKELQELEELRKKIYIIASPYRFDSKAFQVLDRTMAKLEIEIEQLKK